MGSGSVSAVVVTSASMKERAIFIGSISVWDTIGTLRPPSIEIVTLFRPVYCRVMGRKAPRKRLAYRVMIRRTGVPPSTRTSLGAPPTPRFGVSEAKVQAPDADMRRGNESGCLTSGDGNYRKRFGDGPRAP